MLLSQTKYRKKKRGKGKGESSDKSDSDDLEVIKEWNTSSRGGNPEGRNRAEPVEEGTFRFVNYNVTSVCYIKVFPVFIIVILCVFH